MAKKKQIELTIEEKLQNALVPKEEQPYKIPSNWCWTRWGNLSNNIQYGVNTPATTEGNARLVRISDIQENKIIWDKVPYCNIDDKLVEQYLIKENDILFARTGGTVGKSVMAIDVISNAVFAGYLIRSNYSKKLNGKYLKYFMESELYWTQLKIGTTATAQPNCNGKTLGKMVFPLSPINEQQRIVNIIESLFAKLDRAKELIENTLAQFEQNKMAILHKAFTGELTAKWRKENNIDLSSWEKIKLGKVLLPMQTKKPTGQFFRYIDIDAIDNKRQIVKAPKLILTEKAPSRASRGVETGNILFSMVRPYLKNIAQIDSDLSDCIASTGFYVCRCKPELNSRFLYYLFIFDKTIDYLMQFMKGDNSPSIRKDDLLNMKIDLPTIEEQQEIVNILDKLLAKYNKIKNLEQQLEKIELLKKAILAKAFRGELGTNNPDEESAENLLKEILAEK
ncbi:restriction endonuclease subunit S [Megamonas funiformis]|uniref:restriction endonuclease subunit S n=1 Tax=Megamonas funiformis TaxID=437897 RepID=UPI004028C13F